MRRREIVVAPRSATRPGLASTRPSAAAEPISATPSRFDDWSNHMISLTEKAIRESFANASRKELTDLTLPAGFAEIDWSKLDYLGWRDPKYAKRAYIVVPVDDAVIGVVLKQADADPRRRAQCSWCQDVTLPNDVVFYGARRAGNAGRNGNTLGILVCENFECSANVRKAPPMAYLGFDVNAARTERILGLRERAAAFAAAVLAG
jgi:hypothetical protein